jgi:fumarate hydratase class II
MGEKKDSFRVEKDSLGEVLVPADKLWGAQTQRSLKHFSIGEDLIPKEMIEAYALLKKGAALANSKLGHLSKEKAQLIIHICDEILKGQLNEHFPLHVWMTGSGTQFNMNMNEVIANRASQIEGKPLGSKQPVHPNDDVNMSQSSNDSFPSAMYIASAIQVSEKLVPSLQLLRDAFQEKADKWKKIVKIGRTHMQDAVPLTVGQEISGYVGLLNDNLERIGASLRGVFQLALGGTAVGTGLNACPGFAKEAVSQIASLTNLPFISAPNKFTVQGSHDALVQLSGSLKTFATSLYKIANDIRLLSSGPHAGLAEIRIPANEPGSSIMPGKVNPTQCEALAMVAVQVMANDMAVTFGGASGYLEMNVYKPLMIQNVVKSIRILSDSMRTFKQFLVDGMELNLPQIDFYVQRSLMLVTALSPAIGYDKASEIAHYALDHNTGLKEAALKLNYISAEEFDLLVDPKKMV